MSGLSLRDLLCCFVKKEDCEVTVQRQEDTPTHTPQVANATWKGSGNAIAIEGGILILTLAKGILGNFFSFPGTDVAFDVALEIVGHVKTTKDNEGTLRTLRSRIDGLSSNIPSDLSDMHPESRKYFEDFKSNLASLLVPWAEWDKGSTVVKFVLSDFNKARLEDLSSCVLKAVELLQVRSIRENERAHKRQEDAQERHEKLLRDVGRKVDLETLQKVVERLPKNAAYHMHRERPIEVCYGKTCDAILREVKNWASGELKDGQPQLLWLSGLAGTGKSTIAKTIATWADSDDKKILGSSYFFSRDVVELSQSTLVIPHIAYHISQFDPSLTTHVAKTLVEDRDILGAEIAVQFTKLIEEPMRLVTENSRRRMLIVIDGLDECTNARDVVTIIKHMLKLLSTSNPHLRIFLASRPEKRIYDALHVNNRLHPAVARYSLEDFVQTSDIEEYLQHGLSQLQHGWPRWPSKEDFDALVQNCGKLFIYASTVIGFIGGGGALGSPKEHLEILLSIEQGEIPENEPYKQLDDLYRRILHEAVRGDTRVTSKAMHRFRKILGAIFLVRNPLSISSLAKLLEEDEQQIWNTLRHLGAIIIVPPQDECEAPPRIFHPSLLDFLTDENRCADKRFFVDVPHQEAYLFQRCLDIIIEGLKPSGKVKEEFIPVMSYACGHWAHHLEKTPHGDANAMKVLKTSLQWASACAWQKSICQCICRNRKSLECRMFSTKLREMSSSLVIMPNKAQIQTDRGCR